MSCAGKAQLPAAPHAPRWIIPRSSLAKSGKKEDGALQVSFHVANEIHMDLQPQRTRYRWMAEGTPLIRPLGYGQTKRMTLFSSLEHSFLLSLSFTG